VCGNRGSVTFDDAPVDAAVLVAAVVARRDHGQDGREAGDRHEGRDGPRRHAARQGGAAGGRIDVCPKIPRTTGAAGAETNALPNLRRMDVTQKSR